MDPDLLLKELTLIGPADRAEVVRAITAPPVTQRTVDGASTLTVDLLDPHRDLLRSGIFSSRSWANVDGLGYELVGVGKTGSGLKLEFEDSLVAALRRRTGKLSIPAGTQSRAAIASRLTSEAQVPLLVDPAGRGLVQAAVTRSVGDDVEDSWQVLGPLAGDIGWRRFSDGRRILIGSDAWLRGLNPTTVFRENRGPVHDINFSVDVGSPVSEATVDLDLTRQALAPGMPVSLPDLGPASGDWLVKQVERALTRKRGTVTLLRGQAVLPEPPREAEAAAGSESGEPDYIPGQQATSTSTSSGAAGNSARERMVTWALGKKGLPYLWGKSGPAGYDCSGLVQEATRAGGKVLAKGSKAQWAACQRAGKTISVSEALKTRGALLFRMSGDPTHIAISLGDGTCMEARGKAYGCGVFKATGRTWTGGALWL